MAWVEYGYGDGIEATNPRKSGPASIDVDLEHPSHGMIPFTALDESGEVMMQAIWDAATRGDLGAIAEVDA